MRNDEVTVETLTAFCEGVEQAQPMKYQLEDGTVGEFSLQGSKAPLLAVVDTYLERLQRAS